VIAAPVSAVRPAVDGRRVLAGVLLAVIGLGAVLWAPAFTVLAIAIAGGCLWELAQLSARKGPALEFPVALAAVLAYFVLTYFQLIHRYESTLLIATVFVALGTAILTADDWYLARSGYTLLGVLYVGKMLTYFVAIRALPGIGLAATIFVIVLIAVTDIFAMLVGTSIGRTPLTKLSPRKTVEGALGGLFAAVVVGMAAAFVPWLHLVPWQGIVVAVVTSLAAQAGDVVESALKRDAMVKDAGTLIFGHGGVLDRFDSYIFGGIAFYFAMELVGVIPRGLFAS